MIEPISASLIAAAIAAGTQAGTSALSAKKQRKTGKMRSEELKRETYGNLLNEALGRSAELQAHGLSRRAHMGKRKAQSLQETADIVRGAFNI